MAHDERPLARIEQNAGLLGIVIVSDTFAFFVGHAVGRRRLAPSISPGKTVAGAVGGLFGGVVGAFGLGLALVPATIVAVQGVDRAVSGLASGVLNTSRFVGAALGLAVLSTVAANHTDDEIASGTSVAATR